MRAPFFFNLLFFKCTKPILSHQQLVLEHDTMDCRNTRKFLHGGVCDAGCHFGIHDIFGD